MLSVHKSPEEATPEWVAPLRNFTRSYRKALEDSYEMVEKILTHYSFKKQFLQEEKTFKLYIRSALSEEEQKFLKDTDESIKKNLSREDALKRINLNALINRIFKAVTDLCFPEPMFPKTEVEVKEEGNQKYY